MSDFSKKTQAYMSLINKIIYCRLEEREQEICQAKRLINNTKTEQFRNDYQGENKDRVFTSP
jgi:hypothetical protein